MCEDLTEKLQKNARFISSDTSSAVAHAETLTEVAADDVARVRDKRAEGSGTYVALVLSTDDALSSTASYLEHVQQTLNGERVSLCEDESEAKVNSVSNLSKRDENPASEFEKNGWMVMQHFWDIFPLATLERTEVKNAADGKKFKFQSWPLKYNGSLTTVVTRHLMLQFSATAAKCPSLILTLANQAQRFAVVNAVSGPRVRQKFLEEFTELVQETNFAERLELAKLQPNSSDAKILERKLLRFLTQTGKSKPWGRFERQNVLSQLMAIADRHGGAQVFNTLSIDDVHGILTIRLGFASQSNIGFPAFGSDDEFAAWEAGISISSVQKMHEALLSGGGLGEGDDHRSFNEGALQRIAAENAVATTVSFARILQIVDEELVRIIPGQKVTRAIFACRADDGEELCCDSDSVRVGAFGVPIAKCRVIETSGRDALHAHELIVTSASPALLAMYADHDEIFQEIATALETQIKARTDWEVHVVRIAQKALHCRGPPATFVTSGCERPMAEIPEQTAPLQVQLSAATLGNHCHTNSCHEGDRGAIGCRGGYSKGLSPSHPSFKSFLLTQFPLMQCLQEIAVIHFAAEIRSASNTGMAKVCYSSK